MIYLMIALVLLFILVPIISVLPSRRQRERMKMRQQAMAEGIAVQITTMEALAPAQQEGGRQRQVSRREVVGYRIQRPRPSNWRQAPKVDWCLRRAPQEQEQEQKQEQEQGNLTVVELPRAAMAEELLAFLEARVPGLPEDVEQVEERAYNLTVYWHEKQLGSERQVIDFLKECSELPAHREQPPGD